jgi:penicillin-binding protein 1C
MKPLKIVKEFYLKHKNFINKTAIVVASFLILILILNLIFPLPLYRIEDDFSTLHLDASGNLLRITLSRSGKYRIKLKPGEISNYVKKGFVEYEDKTYYINPGINPSAIARAAYLNIKKQRVVSGGSTIAMQLAKLIEPKKKRTLAAKMQEAFRALQLSGRYSKDELLGIYLNTIPMGGNIEGVGAASYLYFNKPPSQLTLGQAAVLIALPKQPKKLRPDRNLTAAYAARDAVLRRIAPALKIGGDILDRAYREEYPGKRFTNPHNLPHLVQRKFRDSGYIRQYFINTGLQALVENKLKNTVDRLKKFGVYNGAVIIADNRTSRVIAYAGSPDFSDTAHSGEIDGANIYRSPGSTLKPLLYGLALDAGIITPKKVVYDIPVEYDGYNPVNAQKKFYGMITAQEALRHSYNSVAVALEYALGRNGGLLHALKKNGFTDMKRNNIVPGLSVVLGSYPMTLEELVTIYSALANDGEMRRLKYTTAQEKIKEKPVRLISRQAAYILAEMLAGGERPDLPQSWEFTYYRGKVAFKTGTSFGLVDALCIGYNPDYTVGVWLGNADCSPSHELVGIRSAAPLVMDIFNALSRHTDSWFPLPAGVGTRKICPVSGDLPGPYCSGSTDDMFIESATKNVTCSVHKQIFVNKKTGLRSDPAHMKLPGSGYQKRMVEDWPPMAAAFLRQTGGLLSEIPPYSRDEAPDGSYTKPKITSPVDGNIYLLNTAMPGKFQKIPLKVAVAGGTEKKIFWFANGKVIASGGADEILFWKPEPGTYKVEVQDAIGESDRVGCKVFEQ